MKHTLRNVFHSPRFLVGFIIFVTILLTVVIYPYFVHRDSLQVQWDMLGAKIKYIRQKQKEME